MVTFNFADKTFYGNTGGGNNYGSWLAYQPEDKLAVAYTTNAKVYPVADIVSGAIEIFYNRPFNIPTFEIVEVSPEVLDKYVGVYSSSEAPVKFTVTRNDAKLFINAGKESPSEIEATASDKFQMLGGSVVFIFDASKKQMIIRRSGGERIFTALPTQEQK